ncbi:MAG: O-methyltransferase [Aggregatilineales bacterium]
MTNQPASGREPSALDQYVIDLFAPEDEALRWIQAEADRNQVPHISLQAYEARTLQIFIKAVGARKVLEIGALAGYSGVWIARALPADGKLITLEKSSKHAQIARASYQHAGVGDKVTLIEGAALDLLPKLKAEAPFDLAFVDADRANYVNYFHWIADALRLGGILAVHNAFANGRILSPQSDDDRGMVAFQKELAHDKRFDSVILGVGDGMVVAVKKS